MNWLIGGRNFIFKLFYGGLLRPILFFTDPEKIHNRFVSLGIALGRTPWGRFLTKSAFSYTHPSLKQTILGLTFPNPVGLAAGFDKNAQLTEIIPSVGFGFEEIGSVTGEPCAGNPGKRLWRLRKDKSLVVYYGLKNDGCLAIVQRLAKKKFFIPLGVNIAKTNNQNTVTEKDGIKDYVKAYAAFAKNKIGAYFTINISCPNAFSGEPFVDPQKLNRLLTVINEAKKYYQSTAPLFLKLPLDLSSEKIDALLAVARAQKIAGFVCANLAKDRAQVSLKEKNIPAQGGLSGRPTKDASTELINYLYKKTGREFVIIGCGGIFSAADAYAKIKSGASLVELITGMIFEGPQLISDINRGLVKLLKKDGYTSISQAIGQK